VNWGYVQFALEFVFVRFGLEFVFVRFALEFVFVRFALEFGYVRFALHLDIHAICTSFGYVQLAHILVICVICSQFCALCDLHFMWHNWCFILFALEFVFVRSAFYVAQLVLYIVCGSKIATHIFLICGGWVMRLGRITHLA
jgi:hypothetical protein